MLSVLAAHGDAHGAQTLIGWVVVIACLIAAGVAAWRALWIACGCLVIVAVVAAYLLL